MFGFNKKVLSLNLNINGISCKIEVFRDGKMFVAKAYSRGSIVGEGRGLTPKLAIIDLRNRLK